MKKTMLALAIALMLTACGDGEETKTETTEATETEVVTEVETETETEEATEEETETEKPKKEAYGLNEPWIVDGQWELTVTKATRTADRNEYSDKEVADVVVVDYTYKNIGYEDEFVDLFLSPTKTMDQEGKMGVDYPGDQTLFPQETPVDGTCDAQAVLGYDNEATTIKIYFEQYDGNDERQTAVFEVPVTE